MARATQLVEQHLGDPSYGVEQLAADLCMERTGLYKKLTALMQQPPVAFIRSIRLHRAAEMLRRGQCSIGDIAERTGFSSPSYFSKCFQKEFGCKPSEYTDE
jgi:AraC-like DNA-binding protein